MSDTNDKKPPTMLDILNGLRSSNVDHLREREGVGASGTTLEDVTQWLTKNKSSVLLVRQGEFYKLKAASNIADNLHVSITKTRT